MYGVIVPVCLTKKSYSEVLEIAKSISSNLEPEKFFILMEKVSTLVKHYLL